jgi:archaellum component FlaF (FlaF/FlaG flagellin family)
MKNTPEQDIATIKWILVGFAWAVGVIAVPLIISLLVRLSIIYRAVQLENANARELEARRNQ